MARTVQSRCCATWALAETGATGPTGNRYGDAAEHACFALAGPALPQPIERSVTLETGSVDRVANMRAFAAGALGLLEEMLVTRSLPK